ncbi:MAG: putative Flap endonuclease 1 [Promethearchaeota archaeon]|nr:MAG: putative Flap endonuclease 1 [Candidatus Lokiarchaeota archaeon]
MGIKLEPILTRKKINLSQIKGTIIAIDAPNIIMSLLSFSLKNPIQNRTKGISNNSLILDRTQRPISHLYGLLYRIKFLYKNKIFPIFCFDGRVSPLKRLITKNQLNDFRITEKRYINALNNDNTTLARKIALSREYLWPNIMKESKELLHAIGIPVIESPAAAEAQCAHLVKKGIADISNSQDYDSVLFGCPKLLQNLSKSHRRKIHGRWVYKRVDPLLTDLQENLKRLELNQFQLIDLAILLKTDYFDGITSIGPKTGLKLIQRYHTLESLISHENNSYDFSKLTSRLIQEIRKLFLLPDVLDSFTDLYWNPPNTHNIFHLLCEEHHLNRERVERNTRILVDNFYKCLKFFQYEMKQTKTIQKTLDMML